jgi:M6 family metalloprotease-like protein
MKRVNKITVQIVLGMLVLMNFATAMPVGTIYDAGNESELPEMDQPVIGEPLIPNDPLEPEDPETIYDPVISGSPPPPPAPAGFDSPVSDPQIGVRPLLTILLEYTDLRHPGVITPSFVQNQIFGPRPSVNDYFLETSYGQFSFSDQGHWAWITAYDDPTTVANATSNNDESTWQYWSNFSDPWNGGTFYRWCLKSLDEAGYWFAALDTDSDSILNFGPEIAFLIVGATPVGLRGGAARWMPPGMILDGMTMTGVGAGVPADSPWITLYSHELAHQFTSASSWPLVDYYAIKPEIIGLFSLMGWSGTSGWAGPIGPHHLDPLSKAKLGWYTPTVVTRDGWVDIEDAETNPVAYILHDPAHGTEEYYMIENRWKGTSYDNTDVLIPPLTSPYPPANRATDIPDEGLLIWHVDETRLWNGSASGGFPIVDLIRRGGADGNASFNGDDANYYDFWSGSSPESAMWNDGTNSNTGVWCVSGAGPTMRVFLDVPGPGVFLCNVSLDEITTVPGFTETGIVPLRNTGDSSDTFTFTGSWPKEVIVDLPKDLTVPSKGLMPFSVDFTPVRHWSTIPGPREIEITATSVSDPSVTDTIILTLIVEPFGDPDVKVIPINDDIEPGMTASYALEITNEGNVVDTFSLSLTGLDFGSLYEAIPSAIDNSWVSFSPTNPSAAPGDTAFGTLEINVPSDWAAWEDATYDFIVTATSSITPDDDSDSGQLVVRATPESMMFWVRAEIIQLREEVDLLPSSDVRGGLHAKATAALNKVDQAIERYLKGDDPPASNHFRTTKNMMKAFLHLVKAQRGKALTDAEADHFKASAEKIREDIDKILAVI